MILILLHYNYIHGLCLKTCREWSDFGPSIDDLQTSYLAKERKTVATLPSRLVISSGFFARGLSQTIKGCMDEWSTTECVIRSSLFVGLYGFQMGVIPKIEAHLKLK